MVLYAAKNDSRSFWMNIAKLSSAAAFSQVVIFLTIPIISRLYSPDAFGTAAIFTSIVLTISPLSTLNYHQAIVLPEKDSDAANIIALCIFFVLSFSALLLVPFGCYRTQIALFFNSPTLTELFWLLPAAVLSRGMYLILIFASTRERSFTTQAISRIVQTISDRIIILGGGFLGYFSAVTIIIGRLVASFLETGSFLFNLPRTVRTRRIISKDSIRRVAKRYKNFPLLTNWIILLSNGNTKLPIYILAFFFSPEVTGLYVMTNRLLQTPMQLLGEAIRRVYYQKAAIENHNGLALRNSFQNVREKLIGYGLFPFLSLYFIADELFLAVLGPDWVGAGSYARIICFLVAAQFISTPIASLVNVLEKQKQFLFFIIVFFLGSFFALSLGGYLNSPETALVLLVAFGVLFYLINNVWIGMALQIKTKDTLKLFTKYILVSLPFLTLLALAQSLFESMTIRLMILGFATLLYYSLVLYLIDKILIFSHVKQMIVCFFKMKQTP